VRVEGAEDIPRRRILSEEEEEKLMSARSRRRAKNKNGPEEEQQDENLQEQSKGAERKKPGKAEAEQQEDTKPPEKEDEQLRKRKTPMKAAGRKKRVATDSKSALSEAETTVKRILEKRSSMSSSEMKAVVNEAEKKTNSHGFVMFVTATLFVVFAVVAAVAGMYGFFAAKGSPIVLNTLLDYSSILGAENGAVVKNRLKRFDRFFSSLDARMQVLSASAIFFVSSGVCGLCWLARVAVKAVDAANAFDPADRLDRLLNVRRRTSASLEEVNDKLNTKQTQEARVECLKRLQILDAQIECVEEQITRLWIEYGEELLAASQLDEKEL